MADLGDQIIALDKERMAAMTAQDMAKLDELIADDLIYTHSSSRLDTKQSLLDNMKTGATVYKKANPSGVQAQVLGDAVVLTGSADLEVHANGAPLVFSVRFTDVYARRDGRWQMVAWQSTKLPE